MSEQKRLDREVERKAELREKIHSLIFFVTEVLYAWNWRHIEEDEAILHFKDIEAQILALLDICEK